METPCLTVEEYWRHPGHKYSELIWGRIVDTPMHGAQHGLIVINLCTVLRAYSKIAGGMAARCGFILQRDPATVLGPDVAFISEEPARQVRQWIMDSDESVQHRWPDFPPILAIEVQDFNEHQDLEGKADFYLNCGVEMVWLVEPRRCAITVRRHDGASATYIEGNIVPGGEVLPGFELPVREIFE